VESLQAAEEAQSQEEAKRAIADHHQVLVANPGDPVAGNRAGDVTVVEFYDPRCPYCKRMLPAIESLISKDHGLRLVYKDIPVLGPASTMEAKAIVAAQAQGGYVKMQAALMHSPAPPTEDGISQIAKDLGLDGAKLVADMNGPAVAQRIQANLLLAKSLKIQGTPVFVVGDEVIPGAVEQPALEAAIADARKHPGH
jgi:protein-disulfide isomerase